MYVQVYVFLAPICQKQHNTLYLKLNLQKHIHFRHIFKNMEFKTKKIQDTQENYTGDNKDQFPSQSMTHGKSIDPGLHS